MRIYEIKKKLAEVEPGGVFQIPGYGKKYLKTDHKLHEGSSWVVDVANGQCANLYDTLTVIEKENTL